MIMIIIIHIVRPEKKYQQFIKNVGIVNVRTESSKFNSQKPNGPLQALKNSKYRASRISPKYSR